MGNVYGLSTREVCDIVGVTYRQLNYWCNRVPQLRRLRQTGSGQHRTFTDAEVEIVRRVAELSQTLEDTKDELRKYGLYISPGTRGGVRV